MEKKDVEFVVSRDENRHPIRIEYKVNNRQPNNMPVLNFLPIEFIEILHTLFADSEELQP